MRVRRVDIDGEDVRRRADVGEEEAHGLAPPCAVGVLGREAGCAEDEVADARNGTRRVASRCLAGDVEVDAEGGDMSGDGRSPWTSDDQVLVALQQSTIFVGVETSTGRN